MLTCCSGGVLAAGVDYAPVTASREDLVNRKRPRVEIYDALQQPARTSSAAAAAVPSQPLQQQQQPRQQPLQQQHPWQQLPQPQQQLQQAGELIELLSSDDSSPGASPASSAPAARVLPVTPAQPQLTSVSPGSEVHAAALTYLSTLAGRAATPGADFPIQAKVRSPPQFAACSCILTM